MTRTHEEQKLALIIGISEYEKLSHLNFCKNDAKATHNLLDKLEYTIEDTLIGTVSWLRMRDALYDFFMNENIRSGDTLIFYFSGHGVTDSNGNMYFATSEIDPFLPNKRGIPFNELTNMIQQSISKKIVVVLDCCYSGTAKLSKNDEYAAAMLGKEAIQEELKNFNNSEGKFILASCQSNQEAYALEENDHSLFTYYFLEGLKGNKLAANEDGYITTSTLSAFIYDEIMSLPSEKRLKQTPVTKMEASGQIIMAYYPNLSKNNNIELSIIESFVTYPEYIKRTDVLPLLRYNKFFGREEEIEKLKEFLKSDKKIMIIVGEQGIGKSRLLLEFANILTIEPMRIDNWKPIFVQPYQDFSPTPLDGKTLIILDEAAGYRDLNKLVDFVLNVETENLKLLLTTMPAFLNSLENPINEINYSTEILRLSKGNISNFLKWNYPYLDQRNRELIEEKCGNSFFSAIIYAEYWKEGDIHHEIDNILSWRVAKYIKHLSQKTGSGIEDVSYIINLVSLVLPIDWTKDKDVFKQILSPHKYTILENILQDIRYEKYENTIVFFQNYKYIRNIIPLHNHVLLDSLKDEELAGVFEELIDNMPYRIIYNVIIAVHSNGVSSEKVAKFLNLAWHRLNNKNGTQIEYLSSIRFITSFSSILSTLNLTELNVNRWLRSYESLAYGKLTERSKVEILLSIFNLIRFYTNSDDLDEMNKVLDQFEAFCQQKTDRDFDVMLGICLSLACDYYGKFNQLKKMDSYLNKLRRLYKKYTSDLYQSMVSSLSSAYINHISFDDLALPRQLDSYLKEMRQIYLAFPDEETVGKYSRALAGAIINSSKKKKINRVLDLFQEIDLVYQKHPTKVKQYIILALQESAPFLSDDDKILLYTKMEKLFVEIAGYPREDNNILVTQNPEETKRKLDELVPTVVDHSIFRFNGEIVLCINDLNMPDHVPRSKEIEVFVMEYVFSAHLLLNIKVGDKNSPILNITLIICPFKILNDEEYGNMIRDMSGLTWEPLINDYIKGNGSFHLTDEKSKLILQNPRITSEQKNNLLGNGPYMYLAIDMRLPWLSAMYRGLQGMSHISSSNSLSYCPYCKNIDFNQHDH